MVPIAHIFCFFSEKNKKRGQKGKKKKKKYTKHTDKEKYRGGNDSVFLKKIIIFLMENTYIRYFLLRGFL